MSVYVDGADAPFGRMFMCHMIADSTDELLEMADRIGIQRKWIQDAGERREHFDVCKSKRLVAIRCGAIPVTSRELVERLRERSAPQKEAK